MPKTIKTKEDIARLKMIKAEIPVHFAALKTAKARIHELKAERTAIKAKYIKVVA